MDQIEMPTPPLTAAQYTQLRADIETVFAEQSGTNMEMLACWSLLRGLWYLINNPTPPIDPPPEDPPPP